MGEEFSFNYFTKCQLEERTMKVTVTKDDGEVLEIYDLRKLTTEAAYCEDYIDISVDKLRETIDEEVTSNIKRMLPIWRAKYESDYNKE